MSVCMLVMCAMYKGIEFLLKAFFEGDFTELHSKISFQPHRQRAHTKLREKERQEVRGCFGPGSYLETPACFLFFWPVEFQSQTYYVS